MANRRIPPRVHAVTGGVGERMAKGAMWMVLARGFDRVSGVASTVILARLLVPADFGLVAMATAIVAMLEIVGMFGFDSALIQNQSASRRHFDTAWTLNIILGAIIAVGLLLIAGPMATFYAEPRLENLVRLLALAAFIQGFENTGIVVFRKELDFRKEFKLVLAKRMVTLFVTIPLAFALRNYWALIAGIVVSRLLWVVLTYWLQDFRPRLSLEASSELFHFGKWLVLTSLLNFLTTRSADFVVGKLAGASQLGLFNMSYEIATLPGSDLVAPINRAIYPGYASQAADPAALKRSYLEVMGFIGVLVLPASAGIASLADILVPLALGPKWMSAIPAVSVLSMFGVLLALKSNNHYVYMALGKTRLATIVAGVQAIILLPLLILGSARAGAVGAATGYLVAQALFTPISIMVLRTALGLTIIEFLAVFYRPCIAAAAMYGAVRAVARSWTVSSSDTVGLALQLLACVIVGVVAYTVALYLAWWAAARPFGPEIQVVNFLRNRFWPKVQST